MDPWSRKIPHAMGELSLGARTTEAFVMCCAYSVVSNSLRPRGLWPARLLCQLGFSRQECWSGLPCSPPGDLSNSGIKPRSPALQVDTLSSDHQGNLPNIRVFSNESALHIKWPQYWGFSISPSNEYSGLIYFRIDWTDLLAVQGTLKSLPQHDSLKASAPWCSAFFMVKTSSPYMTTGKPIAFTIWTFVSKVMSLLLSMMCRFVIAFLPRSKRLLISWLQSPSPQF